MDPEEPGRFRKIMTVGPAPAALSSSVASCLLQTLYSMFPAIFAVWTHGYASHHHLHPIPNTYTHTHRGTHPLRTTMQLVRDQDQAPKEIPLFILWLVNSVLTFTWRRNSLNKLMIYKSEMTLAHSRCSVQTFPQQLYKR